MDPMSETTPGTRTTPDPGAGAPGPSTAMPSVYRDGDHPSSTVPDADARPGLEPVTVGTGPLSIDEVVRVARQGAPVRLADDSLAEVRRTREVVRGLADDTEPH